MIPEPFTTPDISGPDGRRAQRPFGLRSMSRASSEGDRTGSIPVAAQPEAEAERPLLAWAMKVCLAAALVGFGATHLISRAVEGGGLTAAWRQARLAKAPDEPETTGSIGPAARGVALDPCQAPAGLGKAR